MIRALVLGLAVACNASSDHEAPAQSTVDEAVARAEQMLAATASIPYRPVHAYQPPLEFVDAIHLYVRACHLGDARSCRIAFAYRDLDREHFVRDELRRRCLAGDSMSCRARFDWFRTAIEMGEPGYATQQCHVSAKYCDPALLKSDCEYGFPVGCIDAGDMFARTGQGQNTRSLVARGFELALKGCDAGILDECQLIAERDTEHSLEVAERLCAFGIRCSSLSSMYRFDLGDLEKARYAMERACLFDQTDCRDLLRDYRHHAYPEPQPGRTNVVHEVVCNDEGTGLCATDEAPQEP